MVRGIESKQWESETPRGERAPAGQMPALTGLPKGGGIGIGYCMPLAACRLFGGDKRKRVGGCASIPLELDMGLRP